jgi:nucleotide-binding universal stress UspA family protein
MDTVKTILIAVDLMPQSEPIVEAGLRAARAFAADMLLVHAVPQLDSMYGVYLGAGSIHSLQAELEERARTELRRLFDQLIAPSGVTGRYQVLHGPPWSEILRCAVQSGAGLIVTGAHVADKPEHRVLGSTADRVLRNAPCPVLVVPPAREGEAAT